MQISKQCADCRLEKIIDCFYKASGYAGGYHTACKECCKIRTKKSFNKKRSDGLAKRKIYRDSHKEETRSYRRQRKANLTPDQLEEHRRKRQRAKEEHRKRVYASDVRHTRFEWKKLLELCGNKCCRCGTDRNLSKDHVKPLCDGGNDGIDNIQPLCITCNGIKGYPRTEDFRSEEVKNALARWLKGHLCQKCTKPLTRLTETKRFCSRKCSWDFHNQK